MSTDIDKTPIARIYHLGESAQNNATQDTGAQKELVKSIVGMGFLISDRHVLTCAHVIESALGQKGANLKVAPSDTIQLDFRFADPDGGLARSGQVIYWREVNSATREADIAVVRLDEPVPDSVSPARLSPFADNDWRAYGSPKGGYWTGGTFRGRNECGWQQLNITTEDAKVIEGLSGTPVWHGHQAVVTGMMVARMGGVGYQPAFMIPAEVLQATVKAAGVELSSTLEEPALVQTAQTAVPQPSSSVSVSNPIFLRGKQKILNIRMQEYEAAINQLAATQDKATQVILNEKIAQLESEIAQLTDEIQSLGGNDE